MNALSLPSLPGQGRIVADLLMAVAQGGGFASLEGGTDADRAGVLDRLSTELAGLRVRCLRLQHAASGQIGLPELTDQVAAQYSDHVAPGAPMRAVELAFEALTQPAEDAARIVLVVDAADALLRPAIRYVELACQHCPQLRVVLAGPAGFLDGMDQGVAGFRQRVARRFHLPGAPGQVPLAPASDTGVPAGAPPPDVADTGPTLVEMARASRHNAWSLAGAGIAASLLLATWTTNWSAALASSGAARFASAAVTAVAAPVAAVTAALAASPPATSNGDAAAGPSVAVVAGGAGPSTAPDATASSVPPVEIAGASGPLPAEASLPVPPIPPAPVVVAGEASAVGAGVAPGAVSPAAKVPRTAPQPSRPGRNPNERLVSMQSPQPDWRRCREIVLMTQLGERLTSAEQQFLRDGCKAR